MTQTSREQLIEKICTAIDEAPYEAGFEPEGDEPTKEENEKYMDWLRELLDEVADRYVDSV